METRNLSILVVDNPSTGKMIDEMLQKSINPVFSLKHAEKIDKAIELIKENDFDAIFLNFNLQEINGLKGLESITSRKPEVPVILLVDNDNESIGKESLERNAEDYLIKEQINSLVLTRSIHYAIERKKIIAEKKQSEEKYRNLFDSMSEGFALHEVIFDDNGVPCDYRFLDINPAFEKLTGLKSNEIIGKTHNEVLPDDDPYWVKAYGEVALTGEIKKFENYSPALQRYYKVFAFRPDQGQFAVLFTDITEHKQIENALKNSHNELETTVKQRTEELDRAVEALKVEQRRFIDVLDALPVYVILLTEDYHVRFDNKFFRDHFGESHGKCCFDYLFGRTEPCEICETYKVLKTKKSLEWEWTGPDGRNYFISDFPFTDRDGTKLILEMGLDITERKNAEEAVQKEHQRFIEVLDSLPVMICLLTPDYHVAFSNRSFNNKFGESKGLHCYDYCFGYTEPCEFCESYEVFKTGKPHHWEVTSPIDGSTIDVYDFPFTDIDGSPLILEMDIDITERKKDSAELEKYRHQLEELVKQRTEELEIANKQLQAEITEHQITEEALRKSEEKFRQTNDFLEKLFNYANAPMICWDMNFIITRFNQAFEFLTQYRADEVIGKNLEMLFPHDTKEESLSEIKRTLAGEYWEVVEIPILRKDGEIRIALWNSANVYAEDGKTLLATIAQGQDITERKKAEEELRRSNENLEQFAYVASHDLQEPLRIIASYSELLERRYKNRMDSDADDFIEFIVDGAKRMQQLINDLLAYSRIGRMNKKVENIDCNVVLEKVINNMKHVIEENKAVITFDDLPIVKGVEINFIQLFQNFISNAIKFHGEEIPRIHIGAIKNKDEWIFSVKDNGIGIEPQYKDRIFLIFQRLHGRDKYPGTGIGLSICKKIMDTQNGKIWVESEIDKGSTFYFSIPDKGGF